MTVASTEESRLRDDEYLGEENLTHAEDGGLERNTRVDHVMGPQDLHFNTWYRMWIMVFVTPSIVRALSVVC